MIKNDPADYIKAGTRAKATIESADSAVKREMGATAARRGKSDTDCPYAAGGSAWRHWMDGYRSIRPER